MSEYQTNQDHNHASKLDNKTLTLVATALVAASNLYPNDVGKKICAAASPIVSIALGWTFQKCKNAVYLAIEQRRAKNVYNGIISDLRQKIIVCNNQKEKARLNKLLEKHETDLNDLKIKNIKLFI